MKIDIIVRTRESVGSLMASVCEYQLNIQLTAMWINIWRDKKENRKLFLFNYPRYSQ